jgi:hypothetical protein
LSEHDFRDLKDGQDRVTSCKSFHPQNRVQDEGKGRAACFAQAAFFFAALRAKKYLAKAAILPPSYLRTSTRHFAPHRPMRGSQAACTPLFSSKPPSFCSFLGSFCSFLQNMRGIFASVQRLVVEAHRVGERGLLPPRGCPVPRVYFFNLSIFLL